MGKVIRLTESELKKIITNIISEQMEKGPEEKNLGSKSEILVNDILPKKGFKRITNFPKEGIKFCDSKMMGDCTAHQKGSQIIIVGNKGYCFFMTPPQGQSKNGPFTYKECIGFLGGMVNEQSTIKSSSKEYNMIDTCASMGIKTPGYCDTQAKKPVKSCASMGIKTPGFCYVDTKKVVPNLAPKSGQSIK